MNNERLLKGAKSIDDIYNNIINVALEEIKFKFPRSYGEYTKYFDEKKEKTFRGKLFDVLGSEGESGFSDMYNIVYKWLQETICPSGIDNIFYKDMKKIIRDDSSRKIEDIFNDIIETAVNESIMEYKSINSSIWEEFDDTMKESIFQVCISDVTPFMSYSDIREMVFNYINDNNEYNN